MATAPTARPADPKPADSRKRPAPADARSGDVPGLNKLFPASAARLPDTDPTETAEWIESIESVFQQSGSERARFLLARMGDWSRRHSIKLPFSANTDYINTISRSETPAYPGNREIERRIKSYVRWNAMAMVVRANREYPGIGGHISTFASSATLYEVGFNHFFRAHGEGSVGDQIFFQGHASPGIYARAFLEGRLDGDQLKRFRREVSKGGLSSYPHPWLMPNFWEFPTVSMGLASLTAIYQARFNRYLHARHLADTSNQHVWAFLGDGEMDEPESLGAITLASRENLDNLIFVINCNLQRLDGPVRGNGNVIQELEAAFRGAGWNVIKVIWGGDWDPLLEADDEGLLVQRMNETLDGQWQKYTVEDGAYAREHFFGADAKLRAMVQHLSDDQIRKLRLGGHDPLKVHAAYQQAVTHVGSPTVILARTIKGYGMGEAGEGKNITHQQKKLNEDELRLFRDRFEIPIADDRIHDAPFCSFGPASEEYEYLIERRRALGGFVPHRRVRSKSLRAPTLESFKEFLEGSGEREVSTTMACVRMLTRLMSDKQIGKLIVPIVPDEARTFGMEGMFQKFGIYASSGQLYEPVDSHLLMSYREAKDGQILEEGITEAGSMASFTAAGTAYVSHGVNMIPFFLFYSMFGFQRIGDSIWAAGDMRCKGFLLGGTAGRTTLNGEGLQHQDGNSQLTCSLVPNCVSYDPAFAYEIAVIVQDGIRRMYEKRENIFYYLTIGNENYAMPPMAQGVEEGVLRGLYKFRVADKPKGKRRIHLFGSGAIMRLALQAQAILAEKFNVAADVWSATSYNELYRDAMAVERWNRLHPKSKPRTPYFVEALGSERWPVIAACDYVRTVPQRLAPWAPAGLVALGADGFGRSDTREGLRRFFEVDAEHIAYAALSELSRQDQFDAATLPAAIKTLGIDSEAPASWTV
jgi:pyruvate dehydrogenase E1 component